MPKINVIYDLEPNYLNDNTPEYKIKMTYDKEKNIKISDKVFDLMLEEGLLRKTDDGYVFIGKYKDFHKKKEKT
jgi:hypothetical protein